MEDFQTPQQAYNNAVNGMNDNSNDSRNGMILIQNQLQSQPTTQKKIRSYSDNNFELNQSKFVQLIQAQTPRLNSFNRLNSLQNSNLVRQGTNETIQSISNFSPTDDLSQQPQNNNRTQIYFDVNPGLPQLQPQSPSIREQQNQNNINNLIQRQLTSQSQSSLNKTQNSAIYQTFRQQPNNVLGLVKDNSNMNHTMDQFLKLTSPKNQRIEEQGNQFMDTTQTNLLGKSPAKILNDTSSEMMSYKQLIGKSKNTGKHSHIPSNISSLTSNNIDLSTRIFYDDLKDPYVVKQLENQRSNQNIDGSQRQRQVVKVDDIKKKNLQYHFETDDNPDRYLTLKTKRKKDKIALNKDILDDPQRQRAKQILEKAIIDNRYIITPQEFDHLTELEQDLYYSDSLYLVKQPEMAERLTCGLYMVPTVYKVLKKLTFEALEQIKNKQFNYQLLEFKEQSDAGQRCLLLSGMKQFKSNITSFISPEVIASIQKTKTSCSPLFGGNSYAELNVTIDSTMKKEWKDKIQENLRKLQDIQRNTHIQSYKNADVQYNVNLNQTLDPQVILKQYLNVEGTYSGFIEINKRPYFKGTAVLGPINQPPKYEITFPSSSTHSTFGSVFAPLHFQIRDLRTTGRCIGLIRKQSIDFLTDFCSNATAYYIEFPRSSSPMDKLLILSAVQMIDQTFFNKRMPVSSCKGMLCCLLPCCF
eukprot:403376248